MIFSQLRAFNAVAEERSFTRAARSLGVTQPTLSAQVRALEERYGVQLFERRGRGIALTDLGQGLLHITRRLFDVEAQADQFLQGARGLKGGQLRLGADAPYHVIPLLAAFRRRYGGVRLALSLGNSKDVLQGLFDRRTDVAVLPDLVPDDRLHAHAFRREEVVVFVQRGHPWAGRRGVRLAELADQPLILREEGSTTRAILARALRAAAIAPGETFEVGSREAVREAVAAGLGVGAVFASESGNDPRLRLLPVEDADLHAVEFAACLKEKRAVPVVDAFFSLLPRLADAQSERPV